MLLFLLLEWLACSGCQHRTTILCVGYAVGESSCAQHSRAVGLPSRQHHRDPFLHVCVIATWRSAAV